MLACPRGLRTHGRRGTNEASGPKGHVVKRAGWLIGALVLLPVGGCSADKPNRLAAEGWLASQCEAASERLVESGDAGFRDEFESWRELSDPFYGTTDSRMEARSRATASVRSFFDHGAKAKTFFSENCGAEAQAAVRRAL